MAKGRYSQPGALFAALLIYALPLAAQAQEAQGEQQEKDLSLGLSPSAPQTSQVPGGVTPAFGQKAMGDQDWRFDFHGYLQVPLRLGVGERKDPGPDQSSTVIHAPPVVPGNFGTFEYTGIVPDPWVQLNFSVRNPTVMATVIVAARNVTSAAGFFEPPDQMGINDAFLTFNFALQKARIEWNVGAFTNRYGLMGEYDEGRYGTPVIARIDGVGETATAVLPLGDVKLMAEQGFMGQVDKAPLGLEPAGWNGFADPNTGSSLAHHWHLGLGYGGLFQFGLHYVSAFSKDDRATPNLQPDGSISVLGADARLTMGRFGHLFGGGALVSAAHARSVSHIIAILNARGGPGLRDEYLGPSVDGTLAIFAAQYDLSLGRLMRYPHEFHGNGPDFTLSGFGIGTKVSSDDDAYDGILKFKYGAEGTYSMLSWLAAGLRYDRVAPKADDDYQTHAILSPRVILHSDWNSQDQVVLQWSHYFNGTGVVAARGYPPVRDPSVVPDDDVFSISANMWW